MMIEVTPAQLELLNASGQLVTEGRMASLTSVVQMLDGLLAYDRDLAVIKGMTGALGKAERLDRLLDRLTELRQSLHIASARAAGAVKS